MMGAMNREQSNVLATTSKRSDIGAGIRETLAQRETGHAGNVPFYQTNPPFFGMLFDVSCVCTKPSTNCGDVCWWVRFGKTNPVFGCFTREAEERRVTSIDFGATYIVRMDWAVHGV